ncbi:MAG: tRNA pseudouridine(38-40) synthase TruA [Bacteroidales bacterium]|jgi:tRNA pseudouridine38-40 synthase|nr:tRNA pseudouridine(38-40) synthase TruA [Bacteroidales bacterium]
MRFFILLSYNGSSYCGWQRQINGPSVQESLENAFSAYLREDVQITGAGRTDSGVHAVNYIAHLDSCNDILIKEQQTLIYKINAILPTGIVLHNICQVADDAHARFDAVSRTYQYLVHTKKTPFLNDYSSLFPYPLDIDKMNSAAEYLVGQHDFTSMAKLHSDVKNNICTVTYAKWKMGSPGIITPYEKAISSDEGGSFIFTISANRFLRNMVRAIVGSLLEVGRGRQEPEWIADILTKKDRSAAGSSVASHALFLINVKYPYELFKKS